MARAKNPSRTLASVIAETLKIHGVERIFGIPGGGSSLALMEAAGNSGIEFVLTRTETAAAIMAGVTGELTGTPGVVLTGIGPGAASAVNGIAYAWLEKAPVILITDGPASSRHQAFDQNALFRPITKMQGRLRPESGRAVIEAAVRTALAPPWGPVHLDLTANHAASPAVDEIDLPAADPAPEPPARKLATVRRMLSHCRKPVILAGLESRHGKNPAALRALAEALSCPVLPTYKAKGVLPDTHRCTTSLFTGAAAEREIIGKSDLIILFGLDPVELIPGPWPYDAPILDLSPAQGVKPPVKTDYRIIGPLADMARYVLPRDIQTEWTEQEIDNLRRDMQGRLILRGTGHTAQTVTQTVSDIAPPGCRLTVDAGGHMIAVFAFWQAKEPFGVLKSNGLSTMGFALPAAIASALQEPEKTVIAITGDGGMMMCLSELVTLVENRCKIVVLVLNDSALSLIDIKQQRHQYKCRGVRYSAVNFAGAAIALGCRGWRVGPDDRLAPVVKEALDGEGPAVIDITINPDGYGDQLTALRG